MNPATITDIEGLKNDLTVIIVAIGGATTGLVVILVILVIIIIVKLSSVRKELDRIHVSLRSIQKDMARNISAIERLPKSIIQFPMTKSSSVVDEDDRAGTEAASPIFIRKGWSPTPLTSSLTSVTEIPTESQVIHHPLHRNNALPHVRPKQQGPPVPPRRTNSFNNHSFNY